MSQSSVLYTIGHSNQPLESLLMLLHEAGIERVVDVRRYPMSRRNPQFNRDRLAASLAEHGIEYRHMEALGGRREPDIDSANAALRNEQFRGYADYMRTPEFQTALDELVALLPDKRTAVMCAEALPWKCHRSLLADAVLALGIEVVHILPGSERRHELSAHARAGDGRVSYPALL